jgi:hypothetical protein
MEELREKAKRSILLKKPTSDRGSKEANPNSPAINHSIADKIKDSKERDSDSKREVSDKIRKYNDSDSSRDRDVKKSRRSGSSKHRDSRRHKRRDSRSRKRRKRSYSSKSSSSGSRGRRRKRHHRRGSSSSSGSRGRHHSKYRRSHKKSKRRHNSSSGSDSSRSRDRGGHKAKIVADKSSHPYFSKLSKIRRERLAKEREERFWDGFQWVSKESLKLANSDPTAHLKKDFEIGSAMDIKKDEKIVTGKDLRRVVATNLPLDYGLNQDDLANYLITECKKHGDDILFRSIFLNYEQNSGIIECMEKEQTDILIKLDGQMMFGHTLRFTKVADENGFIHGGDSENLLEESAQLTAQAAAIVNSRIRGMQGKGGNSNLNLTGDSFMTTKPSKIIKISNGFDRYELMTQKMFEEMYEDMEEMMLSFGQFNMLKIVRNEEDRLGGKLYKIFKI